MCESTGSYIIMKYDRIQNLNKFQYLPNSELISHRRLTFLLENEV